MADDSFSYYFFFSIDFISSYIKNLALAPHTREQNEYKKT